jgi:hypothetical protein
VVAGWNGALGGPIASSGQQPARPAPAFDEARFEVDAVTMNILEPFPAATADAAVVWRIRNGHRGGGWAGNLNQGCRRRERQIVKREQAANDGVRQQTALGPFVVVDDPDEFPETFAVQLQDQSEQLFGHRPRPYIGQRVERVCQRLDSFVER